MLGSHGGAPANKAVRDADLVIMAGARVGDRAVAAPGQIATRAKVIHIDIDPAEIGKNLRHISPSSAISVRCSPRLTRRTEGRTGAGRMGQGRRRPAAAVRRKAHPPWKDTWSPNPSCARCPAGCRPTVFSAPMWDRIQIWSANHFAMREGRFLTSGGMGTMGYSIPCAVGAKIAPSRQAGLCGVRRRFLPDEPDGAGHHPPGGPGCQDRRHAHTRLGMVRELQDNQYGGVHSGIDLTASPDFVKIAEAYGIRASAVSSNEEAAAALDEMLTDDRPYLLECRVMPDYPSL